MKWVKLVVIILGALVGVFLIGSGAWFALFAPRTFGIVTMVAGVVVFSCALLFHLKWVKSVVIILGALVGAFLIGYGVLGALFLNGTGGIVLIVVGVVVFCCALIFHRQIARPIQMVGKYLWATGKYLWATKYRRWGLILSMVAIVAVGTLLVVQAQHRETFRETLNVLQYNGHAWSRMSSGTSVYLNGVWGSSSSDVFAVGKGGTIVHYDGNAWSTMPSGNHGCRPSPRQPRTPHQRFDQRV